LQPREALAKRNEKRIREKEATCASFIELTKRALDIDDSAHTKAADAEAMKLAKENRIMLANVTIMALEQKDWFEKRQAIIHERDA
jgi:hypothetical protein